MTKFNMCYIGGDLLKGGSKLQREYEASKIAELGINIYNPVSQKDINDKQNQTVESNKFLCDKIVVKDTEALRLSDLIIFDADNDSVGTSCEIGQMYEFMFWREEIVKALKSGDTECYLKQLLDKYPNKTLYFHSTDLRFTEIPEQGAYRSWSLNQYLHGLIRGLSEYGLITFDKILDIIKVGDSK